MTPIHNAGGKHGPRGSLISEHAVVAVVTWPGNPITVTAGRSCKPRCTVAVDSLSRSVAPPSAECAPVDPGSLQSFLWGCDIPLYEVE